jgi:hypothetical protein
VLESDDTWSYDDDQDDDSDVDERDIIDKLIDQQQGLWSTPFAILDAEQLTENPRDTSSAILDAVQVLENSRNTDRAGQVRKTIERKNVYMRRLPVQKCF